MVCEQSVDSSSLSSGASGSSSIAAARRRPPPQPGRMSSSSGRARQTIRSGASLTRSARCSISSSSGSSAQWTSSKTRIERLRVGQLGGPLVRCPRDLLLAALGLDRLEHAHGEREQVGYRLVAAAAPELRDGILDRLVVRDPGGDLDHLGQRPVRSRLRRTESERPARTVAPSTPSANSRARRVLPTPGSP